MSHKKEFCIRYFSQWDKEIKETQETKRALATIEDTRQYLTESGVEPIHNSDGEYISLWRCDHLAVSGGLGEILHLDGQ